MCKVLLKIFLGLEAYFSAILIISSLKFNRDSASPSDFLGIKKLSYIYN